MEDEAGAPGLSLKSAARRLMAGYQKTELKIDRQA
jgi:hypothetical protein